MVHIRQLALAVFEITKKEAEIQQLISQLEELNFRLGVEKKYRLFLFDPRRPLFEKQILIKRIFKNKISNHVLNLISLLIEKNISTNLNQLINQLKKIRNQKFNSAEAKIISALPLTNEEEKEIQRLIGEKLNKKIILRPEIKPEILAGLVIQAEDNLIDLSFKNKLDKLEETLII